jgi:flagellar assembly protein FliH
MYLYRLVARDRLKEDEVRPFQHDLLAGGSLEGESAAEAGACRSVEFQSLDLLQLGPYLLLVAAQEKAREIVAEAKLQAERILDQAAAQGTVEGREKAKQELLPSVTAFANAGQMLIVLEAQMISRYTPQLMRLALDIAEKIVGKALAEDPQIVASVLERAKQEVTEAREIRILLHPIDYELLAEIRPDLVKWGEENGRTIELVASAEVSRGGCRLETEIGMVDATVPTQFAEIHRQLLDEDREA